jgi:hypothetical protein
MRVKVTTGKLERLENAHHSLHAIHGAKHALVQVALVADDTNDGTLLAG